MEQQQVNIKLNTFKLLLNVFIPTIVLSLSYVLLGHIFVIPNILLFCILATFTLVPIELAIVLVASKKEYGTFSLKSAFKNQEKLEVLKIVGIAFIFFAVAGLLANFFMPLENKIFYNVRKSLLARLPIGFDWQNLEYIKSFSKPIIILTCVLYAFLNVFLAPIVEELFFRGYLTSHYKNQNSFTPILIAILFSLYHFWIPFNNAFRILAFAPISYVAYKKKNVYITICFHCLCNLFSTIGFVISVLQ